MKQLIHILCLLCLAFPVSAVPTAETDTLLRVLREELAADFSELQQQDVKPYFMSFRVQETWKANIIASFGYL
nr:TldD/PmbA family protein [Bacteroidaceae bacterium]